MQPLYTHQQRLLDLNPDKCLVAWGTGLGKSRMGLELAKKNNEDVLVVCPKMLREKWQRDIETWGASGVVVTKEHFRRDYKKLPPFNAVIVDEAHMMFANYKSQGHKALAAYFKVHQVQRRWLLTGTPYTSSAWSVYSLLRLLDKKVDFWDFRRKFFVERYFGQRCVFVPRDGVEDDVADLVRSAGSVVRMDEWIDMPEQTIREQFFALTKEQKALLEEVKLTEQNPLARFSKYHQIASGTLLGNEFTETKTVKAEKNDYIMRIIGENDKVAVFCRYNAHIDLLAGMCEKAKVPYRIIRGGVDNRDEIVKECEDAKRMVVLINTGCSVGYELPSFGVCVFASLSYSMVDYQQAMGRFLRINKPKPNLYIICTTRDSADVPVWESVKRKENFSEAIFARERMGEIE